jgi:hypothetical protein
MNETAEVGARGAKRAHPVDELIPTVQMPTALNVTESRDITESGTAVKTGCARRAQAEAAASSTAGAAARIERNREQSDEQRHQRVFYEPRLT